MIKTWQDRVRPNASLGEQHPAMQAEIDELRAALAKLKAQEPFGSVVVTAKGEKLFYELTSRPYLDNAQAYFSVYLAAGAQGHPREQITPMSESDFIEWFGRNYPYDTVIFEPDWHARSIYRRVTRTVSQGKEQGHAREQPAPDRREGLTAHHVYCRAVTEDV